MTQDILAEAVALITGGVREIVLTGIQVASYGEDTGTSLAELIYQVSALDGVARLRLSSIEPCAVDDGFLAAVQSSQVLCDHFHLSLQSGCDATLRRMNRRYTTAQYEEITKHLRNIRPNAALTTDIIVGFPGETDDEFDQSLAFVQKIGFSHVHVFEYSKREGTPAAIFTNQVPDNVKSERSEKMRNLAVKLQQKFFSTQIGSTANVLFETSKIPGKWLGHTGNYCPVTVNCEINLSNIVCQVKILACTSELEGVITEVLT